MQKWEYLTLDFYEMRARQVNGHEFPNWKKISLFDYLNTLGNDGWEMVGTLTSNNYTFGLLFFKRPKP